MYLTSFPESNYDTCVFWRYVCDRFSHKSRNRDGWFFGTDIMKELLSLAQPGATIDWNVLLSWAKNHPEAPLPAPNTWRRLQQDVLAFA